MDYYTSELFEKTKKQRKLTITWYVIASSVMLLASVGLFIWYRLQPYKDPTITTIKIIQFSLLGIFVIFSFLYLGIVFKRVNRFYRICNAMQTGIRETWVGNFIRYDEKMQEQNGVDYKSLIFLEWNKYKNDFFERKVLVFYEKPFPEIEEGKNVKFVTQSNVLISYEILDTEE